MRGWRSFILAGLGLLGWLYSQFIDPIVKLWVENWATDYGAAKGPPPGMIESFAAFFATVVAPCLSYLTGPFGLGFIAGGAIFGISDILAFLKQKRASARAAAEREAKARLKQFVFVELGSVDVLPQEDASGDEMDEGEITARQLVEAGEDAPVVLHETEQVLDLVALAVEVPVGRSLVDAGGSGRDHRKGSTGRGRLQDGVRVISLVGDHRCGRDAVEQGQGLRGVVLLPGGQAEGQRVAEAVAGSVQLAGEAMIGAADHPSAKLRPAKAGRGRRAAERLLALAFFAPAAPAWARTTVLSSMTHSRSASAAR